MADGTLDVSTPARPPKAERFGTPARDAHGDERDGDRRPGVRVWRTALIVALPLLLLLVVAAAIPRPYYTGTDSVRTRGFVQPVPARNTLCVNGLNLPADTGRVQFEILTGGPVRPALRLRLHTPSGTVVSSLPPGPAPASTRMKVAFPIPERAGSPASVPASACVTPQRIVNFGGTVNIGGAPPTLDGAPEISRIAVWFLPPAGSKRSFLAQVPDVLRRVALFRPGIVGPWTYVLLLLLVLPGAALLGLRLLARAERIAPARLGAGVFAVAFLVAAGWALITPAFQAPDEQDHFAYVEHLAQTGHAPSRAAPPSVSPWSSSEMNAIDFTRVLATNEQADGRPPWLKVDEQAWAASVHRQRLPESNGGGTTTAATHGPVYYGALVPAYLATEHASVWSQLTAMRLVSAAIGALAALFAFLTARELWPRRPLLAVAAGLLVAFQPMYTFISGSVNNDVGVNAAAAATIFLLVRTIRRGLSPIAAVLLGLVVALLPLIKGTGYELYPVVLIALAGVLWKRHDRRTLLALGAAAASFATIEIAWSAIAPSLGHSTFTTPGGNSPVAASSAFSTPGLYLSYLWQVFLPKLPFMHDHFVQTWPFYNIYIVRAWASFGWYTIQFPQAVYLVLVAALAAGIVLAALAVRREWRWVRGNWLVLLVLVLTPLAVIAGVESAYATIAPRPILAEMGRYLFPAITALAVLAVGATFGAGRRRAGTLAVALVSAEMVFAYASILLMLRGFYT